MGIPAGTLRVTLSGRMGTGEVFATSFYCSGGTPDQATDAGALLIATGTGTTAVKAAFGACLSTADSYLNLDTYLYTGGPAATAHGHAAFVQVGTGAVRNPPQCALVLTLRSTLATRSGRGRMYIPGTGIACTGPGTYNPPTVDSAVDALANWFSSLKAGGAVPVVVSQLHTSTAPVSRIDADYVPDTQRSRVNKLVTSRHGLNVT